MMQKKQSEKKIHKPNRTYSITSSNIWIGKSIKRSNYAHTKKPENVLGILFLEWVAWPNPSHYNALQFDTNQFKFHRLIWPLSVAIVFHFHSDSCFFFWFLWCILCKLWCELKMLIGKSTQKSISVEKNPLHLSWKCDLKWLWRHWIWWSALQP